MSAPHDETLLRKYARDAGFDLGPERAPAGGWLLFRASGNLATLWLRSEVGGAAFRVAAAPARVVVEVGPIAGTAPDEGPHPPEAAGSWRCDTPDALLALCRRVAVLGHVLPDQVLRRYEVAVAEAEREAGAASTTERLAEVRRRVGQEQFREALLAYWGGRCALTGCTEPLLLRASHAKPWKDATDRERLDVHNGLLLVAHLDAAFDAGLIAVAPDGRVLVAAALGAVERRVLGVDGEVRVVGLAPGHVEYLRWHRERVFRDDG